MYVFFSDGKKKEFVEEENSRWKVKLHVGNHVSK